MSIVERKPVRQSPVRLPGLNQNMVLGAIAAGFLVLHILAGALLLPASGSGPETPQENARAPFTD
jgi:hypothetical protein